MNEHGGESSFQTKYEVVVAPSLDLAREKGEEIFPNRPKLPPDTQEITILKAEIALMAPSNGYWEPTPIIANALGRRGTQLHCAKMATSKGNTTRA